jgi:hypothetical protein
MVFPFYGQTPQELFLQPEKSTDIAENHSVSTFRCNKTQTALYLNGEYQGIPTLTIKDLIPGIYRIRIEKQGYEKKEYLIYVERSKALTWYIELN